MAKNTKQCSYSDELSEGKWNMVLWKDADNTNDSVHKHRKGLKENGNKYSS